MKSFFGLAGKDVSVSGVASSSNVFENEMNELLLNQENEVGSNKKSFEVRDVAIPPKDLSRLGIALKMKYLERLALVGVQMMPSGMQQLADGLKINKFLKVIDFSGNSLGDQGVETLMSVIKFKSNVQEVYLRDTKLTADGCAALGEMLKFNKKVSVLDLSNNFLGDEGIKAVFFGIVSSPHGDRPNLMKLLLKNCDIKDGSSEGLRAVLSQTPTLKEIDLSGNSLGPKAAKDIANGLMKKKVSAPYPVAAEINVASYEVEGLEALLLDDNKFGDDGVKELSKALPTCTMLKRLSLRNVGMKADGLGELCSQLIETFSVKELYLGSNKVEEGKLTKSVTTMLSRTACESLDVSHIKMSSDDVKAFGNFLGENIQCRLSHLSLADCNINDEGATILANGLKFNVGLKSLNVTSNPFGPKGAFAFAKTFKRAKNLETFYVTGMSRIGAEGENYLAECLKFNKKLTIKGATKELDYMSDFLHKGGAFVKNANGELSAWSEEAWSVVKRGCGQIIGTVIYNMDPKEFREFKANVLLKSRNVVNQTMFEYVLRHAEAPAIDVVSIFIHKCRIPLDTSCDSKASISMAKEKRKSDDVTYRFVAKDYSKDPMVREMAKNNELFLGRYLTEQGPPVYKTHEVTRSVAKDTLAAGERKGEEVFVQIYENDFDFVREKEARAGLQESLRAGGPFAIYDTILKEVDVHEDSNVIAFYKSFNDLRNSICNLGVTAGFDMNQTTFLAKRAAQCLGTINNLGRIHGDFRPRNFVKVAHSRWGDDPLGRSKKQFLLPEKWVLFDLSKSVEHGTPVSLRLDSSYLPPEVARVTFNTNYQDKALPVANEKMDVWSFGVVLYQLLTGIHLFHTESNTDRMFRSRERLELMNWINLDSNRQKLVLHRANEALFENKSTFLKIKEAAIDLLNWCLQGDPHNRPTFNDILSHPFFEYKTNVNYSDIDLLLGWYHSIGSSKEAAMHKNDRTHAHVVNTTAEECSDVFKVLKHYYDKAGCVMTNDSQDWKKDINVRRDEVQKARCLIVLMTKDVFWKPNIMQKLMWALDSLETTTLVLLDVSTAGTNAAKFEINEFVKEMEEKNKIIDLVESLTPVSEKLDLHHIDATVTEEIQRRERNGGAAHDGAKWLAVYIRTEVKELVESMKDKVIPYRTRPFQTQAMVDEILVRSGFIPPKNLKPFSLHENNKELIPEEKAASKNQKKAQILILFHETNNNKGLRNDVLKLRSKLLGMETGQFKADVVALGKPNEVYQYFKREGGSLVSPQLTLVLCMVSPGFYENFREVMVSLNAARGLVSVVPIAYDEFNVKQANSQTEILNLGIDSDLLLKKLKDQRSYIPLPSTKENLDYETKASLDFIYTESLKQLDLTKQNEAKDKNDVYTRYENTNFFKTVY